MKNYNGTQNLFLLDTINGTIIKVCSTGSLLYISIKLTHAVKDDWQLSLSMQIQLSNGVNKSIQYNKINWLIQYRNSFWTYHITFWRCSYDNILKQVKCKHSDLEIKINLVSLKMEKNCAPKWWSCQPHLTKANIFYYL